MSRIIKAGLIQAHNVAPADAPIEQIKKANIDHQMKFVEDAARQGVQMLCFQEIFTTPYFCAEQTTRWYEAVEKVPDGPTVKLMQDVAKQFGMVIVVPIYEEEISGIYYNTAAVIDADGKYLGKYRKTHIPHVAPGFWEKFYFRPGNLGYPCFDVGHDVVVTSGAGYTAPDPAQVVLQRVIGILFDVEHRATDVGGEGLFHGVRFLGGGGQRVGRVAWCTASFSSLQVWSSSGMNPAPASVSL